MAGIEPATPAQDAYQRLAGGEPDLGLFSPGGPFESFPGPVLVVGHNTVVLCSNEAAEPLADLVRAGGTLDLRSAVSAAFEGRAAQINPLLLEHPDSPGEVGRAYDLIVLPWADAPAALLLARDITLERSLRSALVESRQRYRDLVEASCDFAWECDEKGRFTFVSDAGALDYAASDLVGQPVQELLMDDQVLDETPFAAREPVERSDVWFQDQNGGNHCMAVLSLPLEDAAGEWRGCRGLCWDVTAERSQFTDQARSHNRELVFSYVMRVVQGELDPARMLEAAAKELISALPASGAAIYRRLADKEMKLAAQAGETLPEPPPWQLLEARDFEAIERSDGCRVLIRPTCHRGRCNGALCVWHEEEAVAWGEDEMYLLEAISAQVAWVHAQADREEQLERLSSTDSMTGLLNRRTFLESVQRRLHRAGVSEITMALMFVDIDDFKSVNDNYGHHFGDRILQRVGEILNRNVRDQDLAGRLGGDEFALLIGDIRAETAIQKAEKIIADAAQRPPDTPSGFSFSLSIGIALFDPHQPEEVDSLMARADRAMYRVKRAGKAGIEVAPDRNGDERA